MKAERQNPFVPVVLTLESQEEVDSVFVLFNHTRITKVLPGLVGAREALSPFVPNEDGYLDKHCALCKIIKR